MDKRSAALGRPGRDCTLPRGPGERAVLEDRLLKERGVLTAVVVPGTPNALPELEVLGPADGAALRLALRPRTGRTHQLRIQLSSRGAPIVGEDLYPVPQAEPHGPLRLLARSLAFTDPITGRTREFHSHRTVR